MSSISIIGLGNMASALADKALASGNTVELIGRDPAKANELAGSLDGATVGAAGTAGQNRHRYHQPRHPRYHRPCHP
jgi:3-hydroxyisobutyrate dehydrogenase-like beta-hydroxyacid dehydrogenase